MRRRGMIAPLHRSPAMLLTLTAMMWAMNAIVGQLAAGEVTPFAIVLLRWVVVAAMMWALYGKKVREHWPRLRPRLGFLIATAFTGFTGFNWLLYIASLHSTAINIGIIQGAMPVMVLIGAFLVHRDKVGPAQAVGVAVTLLGVALVATRGDLRQILNLRFNYGEMLMLAGGVFYAAYTVALRRRPDAPGEVVFTVFSIIAMVTALPPALWEAIQPGYAWPTVNGYALSIFVAIFPSCIGQLFFLRGVDMIGPGRAGAYINLVPVFAAVLAILILGESFEIYHAIALSLVIGGIWLAERGR